MAIKKYFDTEAKPERAVLVGLITTGQTEQQAKEYLDELAFLVDTAGGICERSFTQKMQKPERATFVGTGKLGKFKLMLRLRKLI